MRTFILIITLVLFTVSFVYAHPASSMNVSFDKNSKTLKVSYVHKVSNESEHYIESIKITNNKKDVVAQYMTKQDNKDGGSVYYKITDAKTGDKITVTSACNKGGKKSETITIE